MSLSWRYQMYVSTLVLITRVRWDLGSWTCWLESGWSFSSLIHFFLKKPEVLICPTMRSSVHGCLLQSELSFPPAAFLKAALYCRVSHILYVTLCSLTFLSPSEGLQITGVQIWPLHTKNLQVRCIASGHSTYSVQEKPLKPFRSIVVKYFNAFANNLDILSPT